MCENQLGGGEKYNVFLFYRHGSFPKFDMVVSAPPQLTMWYNDLDGDHRRTLNKYVDALTELININGWPELIKVLTGYWDSRKMVFCFRTDDITLTLEETRYYIDTVGTKVQRRARKQEDILIPNKPSVEDIADWFGLRKDFAYWCQESHVEFRDLYI